MQTAQVRPANFNDLESLILLENTCFDHDKISQRSFRHLLSVNSAEVWVIEYHQGIIGYGMLFFRKHSKKARLYSIAIYDHYREHGNATRLYEALEHCAVKRGCDMIILEVRKDNAAAIAFYQKKGFDVFGQYLAFYEDRTDALRMKKTIGTNHYD